MHIIKYLFCIILMTFGFLFSGELNIYYLNGFQESYYRTGFAFVELKEWMTNEFIVNDFLQSASDNNVDIYTVEQSFISDSEVDLTIWGTDRIKTHLMSIGIEDKKYASIFSGSTQVVFKDIKDIKNITEFEFFYIISKTNKLRDIEGFKIDLIDNYGGGFPKIYGSERETIINLLYIWGSIFVLLLILTLYSLIFQKKEIMVKITLGGNIFRLFLKNILCDGIFYILSYIVVSIILSNISNVYFKKSYIDMMFVLFITLVILINLLIFNVNLKKNFSNSNDTKGFLVMNYMLKIITTVVSIVLLSGNFILLNEWMNYNSQIDFFREHKDYKYFQLNYKDDYVMLDDRKVDTYTVLKELYARFQDRSLQYIDLSQLLEATYPLVLINLNAKNELVKSNIDLENLISKMQKDKMYLFIPSKMKSNIGEIDKMKAVANFYFDSISKNEIIEVVYKENISLIGIHDNVSLYGSQNYKNPMILFDPRLAVQMEDQHIDRSIYYAYHILYDISDDEFNEFVRDFELEDHIIKVTNALEKYEINLLIISRLAKMVIVLTFFIILIELIMIILIIRLEYSMNAIEYAMKKVLGYSMWERNRRIVCLSICGSLISFLVAFILDMIFNVEEAKYLILGSCIIFTLEVIYIFLKIMTIEKVRISSILKGERI